MTVITQFKTQDGTIYTGQELQDALDAVADRVEQDAYALRREDLYADHVTEERKDQNLRDSIDRAQRIREGHIDNFTIAQRLHTKLTGHCPALLQS